VGVSSIIISIIIVYTYLELIM